jgi:SPP1 family phage portal protein
MTVVIPRSYVTDVDNPPIEVLARAIEIHQTEIERLEKLFKYYDGQHEILDKKYDQSDYKNIVINEAKKISDLNTDFALGNPVSYSSESENDISTLLDVLDDIDINAHDIELEKDLSVFGYSNELHYVRLVDGTEETQFMIQKIDPRGSFVVVDNSLDKVPMFAVRYFELTDLKGESSGYQVEVYAPNKIILYTTEDLTLKKVVLSDVKDNLYGKVPMIEFRNNEEKQGDFESAISLIDAYNQIMTDRLNDKEAHLQAVLISYGYSIVDAIEATSESSGKELAVYAPDPSGRTEYLTNPLDETQVEILAKRIKDDIHEITNTPNLNDENFAGNISGEAMKWKIFGLLNNLGTKQRYFIKGIKQRLSLLQSAIKLKYNVDLDIKSVEIKMKPFIPTNLSEVISNIAASQDFIPLAFSLGWLPDVDNPDELIEQMSVQKAENIAENQAMLGVPNANLEEGAEDDKGNG